MYPVLFHWGSFILPSWHFFYVIGAIAGYFLFLRLLDEHHPEITDRDGARIFAVCYLFGYFGARALSIVVEEPNSHTLATFFAALLSFGSMTFYGGAIAGFFAGFGYVILRRISLGKVLDSAIPAFLLALGIGRIGCFLNGDDYGAPLRHPSDIVPWWAATFPNLADGTARYPVQLWEAAFGVLAAILLFRLRNRIRKVLRPGGIGVIGIFLYAVFRFWNEYYRGDDRKWVIEGKLSTSQGISAIIILLVIGLLPVWLRKPESAVEKMAA